MRHLMSKQKALVLKKRLPECFRLLSHNLLQLKSGVFRLLRARMETVREHEEQKREQMNILELSQRKQMRHKSRKMYDDFTTVQEILAHGARNSQAPSETSSQSGATPLLSVTTV